MRMGGARLWQGGITPSDPCCCCSLQTLAGSPADTRPHLLPQRGLVGAQLRLHAEAAGEGHAQLLKQPLHEKERSNGGAGKLPLVHVNGKANSDCRQRQPCCKSKALHSSACHPGGQQAQGAPARARAPAAGRPEPQTPRRRSPEPALQTAAASCTCGRGRGKDPVACLRSSSLAGGGLRSRLLKCTSAVGCPAPCCCS